MQEKERFYRESKKLYRKAYWSSKPKKLSIPNGFKSYPQKIYDLFASQINRHGKVIDLGCGNGLLLKHLAQKSRGRLIPFGIDYLEESIEQAKKSILPKYKNNFKANNIINLDSKWTPFDYIILDPYDIHPQDWKPFFNKLINSLTNTGRIIFYAYRDTLVAKGIKSIGDCPFLRHLKIKKIERDKISMAIYQPYKS